MPPVSMKMAKLQKATLDPSKISGRCGRLKCCLRYEYDTYEEHRKELPPVGATVVTKQGTGRVVGLELLAQKLLISYEGQRQILTDARDVLTVVSTKSPKPPAVAPKTDSPNGGGSQPGQGDRKPRGQKKGGDSRPNPRPRNDSDPNGPQKRANDQPPDDFDVPNSGDEP
jgi:hypothetical protein